MNSFWVFSSSHPIQSSPSSDSSLDPSLLHSCHLGLGTLDPWFPRPDAALVSIAAVTDYHILSGLTQPTCISSSSEGQKSEMGLAG